MTRTRARLAVAALLGLLALAGPASAQTELPPLPLPTVPSEAQPVLEIVAPLASPQCGNATLVVALAPGVIGGAVGPLPLDILPLLGPAFVICGSIPVPEPSSRLVCAVDDQVLAALTQVTVAAAGLAPPVDTRIVGPLAEILVHVQDNLPPPANTAGLAEMAAATLACRAVRNAAPPDDAAVEEAAAPEPPTDTFSDELALPDLGTDLTVSDEIVGGDAITPSAEAPNLVPVADVGSTGFAYPVVFALPLLLLVIGGYLGRALTQPVDSPQR